MTEIAVGPTTTKVAERIMASVRSIGSWEGEFSLTRRDGSRFPAYVRDVVVPDNDGRPLGLVGVPSTSEPGPKVLQPRGRRAPTLPERTPRRPRQHQH